MKKNLLLSLGCILALNCAFSGFVKASEQDDLKLQVENLFEASKKVNNPEPEKEKSRKEIDKSIDWEGISRLCLGEAHSNKYKGKNFGEFRDLLREVILKTAFSRMDKFWTGGTKAQIDKVDITGAQAHVGAKFTSNNETFSLDYYLNKKGNQWFIHDVAYEDMKYSVNIKEQLDAFLKEKSFSDLLTKLRKKREDLDKPAKTKSS